MVTKLLHEGIGTTGLKFLSKGNTQMRFNNSPGSLRRGNFLDCVLDSKPGLVASLSRQYDWNFWIRALEVGTLNGVRWGGDLPDSD